MQDDVVKESWGQVAKYYEFKQCSVGNVKKKTTLKLRDATGKTKLTF